MSSPPSCSKDCADSEDSNLCNSGVDLEIYMKNDNLEIDKLLQKEQDAAKNINDEDGNKSNDEHIAKIEFKCATCGMHELVHYFGETPNFVYGIRFSEPTYVMRDPFQPPPPRWKRKAEHFIAIGSQCHVCDSVVCKDAECSFFYLYTYCLTCARLNASLFPEDIQLKFRRQLSVWQHQKSDSKTKILGTSYKNCIKKHCKFIKKKHKMSALFNFQSLLSVILLMICTCAYLRSFFPSIMDRNKTGLLGVFWKLARIGERKSPYVAVACLIMAASLLFWT